MVPSLSLPSTAGATISTSDYRSRRNLVLILADSLAARAEILMELAEHYAEFQQQEAEILVIAPPTPENKAWAQAHRALPFPLLWDDNGVAAEALGAEVLDAGSSLLVYVADRFGEIYSVYRPGEGYHLPTVKELLETLEFIEVQCPE